MLQALEALSAIAGRRLEVVRSPRREGDATRTAADTSRIAADLGCPRGRRSRRASRLSGAGPLMGSRPHEQWDSCSRAGGRAGGRPRLRLGAPPGALVASWAASRGRYGPPASPSPCREDPCGEQRRSSTWASRSRPRRRADPEPGHEPADRSEIIRSESALEAASEASGVPVSKLRSSVSTKELTAVGQARGINLLMEIAVKASGRTRAEPAAGGARGARGRRCSSFVSQKVELLGEPGRGQQLLRRGRHRADPDGSVSRTLWIWDQSILLDQRLLLSANLNSVIT